jgi:precorrin-3B methylase
MLDSLSDLLEKWCQSQQLEFLSADDLLYQNYNKLTSNQRHWLHNYIELWDATQDFEININNNNVEQFIPTLHD